MAKYDPLNVYLKRQRALELELTLRQIENLIGYLLPRSAENAVWWSGEGAELRRVVQLRAWRAAHLPNPV
ncbi:MAG: hypothetical protein JWR59_1086 [Brevundimonas sp.]|nr:hypothetical protein [Brevundimonas sp.]